MTGQEKKALALQKIAEGDPRSYNEFMADLELQIWTEKNKGPEWIKRKLGLNKIEEEGNE